MRVEYERRAPCKNLFSYNFKKIDFVFSNEGKKINEHGGRNYHKKIFKVTSNTLHVSCIFYILLIRICALNDYA